MAVRMAWLRAAALAAGVSAAVAAGGAAVAAGTVDVYPPLADGADAAVQPQDGQFHDVPGSTYNECLFILLQLDSGQTLFINFLGTQVPAVKRKAGVEISVCPAAGPAEFIRTEYPWPAGPPAPDRFSVQIGPNAFSGWAPRYALTINEPQLTLDLSLTAAHAPARPGGGKTYFGSDRQKFIDTLIVFARARAEGSITHGGTTARASGWAYCDRTYQNILGSSLSDRWYSLRYHDAQRSVAFVAFQTPAKFGAALVPFLIAADDTGIVGLTTKINVTGAGHRRDPKTGYNVPAAFAFSADGDGFSVAGRCEAVRELEQLDILAHMSFLERNLVKTFFARPVFYRFASACDIGLNSAGATVQCSGPGVQEYVQVNQ